VGNHRHSWKQRQLIVSPPPAVQFTYVVHRRLTVELLRWVPVIRPCLVALLRSPAGESSARRWRVLAAAAVLDCLAAVAE
jgi:hypothetical protein